MPKRIVIGISGATHLEPNELETYGTRLYTSCV